MNPIIITLLIYKFAIISLTAYLVTNGSNGWIMLLLFALISYEKDENKHLID